MTDDYRARLIEAVQRIGSQHEAREMSDEELTASICTSLGLPSGTQFTEEQLSIIADYPKGEIAL